MGRQARTSRTKVGAGRGSVKPGRARRASDHQSVLIEQGVAGIRNDRNNIRLAGNLFFTCGFSRTNLAVAMDTILSWLNGDLSIWGIIAMPVGVAICFGPAVIIWLEAELKSDDEPKDRRCDE